MTSESLTACFQDLEDAVFCLEKKHVVREDSEEGSHEFLSSLRLIRDSRDPAAVRPLVHLAGRCEDQFTALLIRAVADDIKQANDL